MGEVFYTLIPLSGGFDSTACLLKALEEAKQLGKDVLVLHVENKTQENRSFPESVAVSKILEYIQSQGYTNYKLFNPAINYKDLPHLKDIETIGFFIATALRVPHWTIESVTIPMSAYDKIQDELEKTPEGLLYADRSRRRYNLIKAITEKEVDYVFPIEKLDREAVIRLVPKELRSHIHFCRKPHGAIGGTCGRCRTCLNTLPVLQKINKEENEN